MKVYRIKDNVGLKKLKKFGFIESGSGNGYIRRIEQDEITKQCAVCVYFEENPTYNIQPRFLYILTPLSVSLVNENNNWVINDLIWSGIIEMLEVNE